MTKGSIVRQWSQTEAFGDGVHYYFTLNGRDVDNRQVQIDVEVPDSDYTKYTEGQIYYPVVEKTKEDDKDINDRNR